MSLPLTLAQAIPQGAVPDPNELRLNLDLTTMSFDYANRTQDSIPGSRQAGKAHKAGKKASRTSQKPSRAHLALLEVLGYLQGYLSDPESFGEGRVRYTYFIRNTVTGLIKIGKSFDVLDRVNTLSLQSGCQLELLVAIPVDVEARLHEVFSSSRGLGEWFQETKMLRDFINVLISLHCMMGEEVNTLELEKFEMKGEERGDVTPELDSKITEIQKNWPCEIIESRVLAEILMGEGSSSNNRCLTMAYSRVGAGPLGKKTRINGLESRFTYLRRESYWKDAPGVSIVEEYQKGPDTRSWGPGEARRRYEGMVVK